MRLTKVLREAYVKAALQDIPTIDYDEQIRKLVRDDNIASLPVKVRAVYEDESLRDWLATGWFHSRKFPGMNVFEQNSSSWRTSPDVKERCEALAANLEEQNVMINKLREKLRATAESMSTTQQLADAIPEFAQYLPTEPAKVRNLPAIANVVSEFVMAGWPKKGATA